MPFDSSSGQTIAAEVSPAEPPSEQSRRRRRRRCKTRSPTGLRQKQQQQQRDLTMHGISDMIEQIRRCESILADGLGVNEGADEVNGAAQQQQLSARLLAKVNRLKSLRCGRRPRPASFASSNRNNSKCCNGATSTNAVTAEAALLDTELLGNTDSSYPDYGEEGPEEAASPSGSGERVGKQAYPKHQDYCLCHKRKCQRCGCLCPCTEHACPSCGYTSRMVMTMRAVDGLKEIANAQKSRYRNGRRSTAARCKSSRKRFLLNDSGNECSHAVMVRVGGGFVPLVEYLKSHNKVVLSKFTRGDGSAFLSPWRPYYAGPLKRGRPRGIRYVDSVTQQLEELIFANREAGKTHCVCP